MECHDGEFKVIEWTPAYDKRDPDSKKNYGIHGMNLRFMFIGPKGATQFLIYTNWMLPQNREVENMVPLSLAEPLPADVGYHAYVPQYEDQNALTQSCEYLGGKPCYYDGSVLQAEELFDEFVANGEEVIWTRLRKLYDRLIGP